MPIGPLQKGKQPGASQNGEPAFSSLLSFAPSFTLYLHEAIFCSLQLP